MIEPDKVETFVAVANAINEAVDTFTKFTAGTYAIALAAKYLTDYRTEEIGLIGRKRIIYNGSGQQIAPVTGRQFTLIQTSEYSDFELRQIPPLEEITEQSTGHISYYTVPVIAASGHDNKHGLEALFKKAAEHLEPGDVFYFATSRHGGYRGHPWKTKVRLGEAALTGFRESDKEKSITVPEFGEMFQPVVDSGSVNVLYFDCCLGGNFAKELGKGNTTAMASSSPGKILTVPGDEDYSPLLGLPVDHSVHPSRTRWDVQSGLFSGKSVLESFDAAGYVRTLKVGSLTLLRPFVNRPHMYVGDIDPATVKFV